MANAYQPMLARQLGIGCVVQLKITLSREAEVTLIRVDGWLAGAGVAEFARVMESAPKPVRLLLHDLRGADTLGLALLRGLADLGTPLEGLSPYLKLVLADGGARASSPATAGVRPGTPVRSKHT
jgi:hypothetical protein